MKKNPPTTEWPEWPLLHAELQCLDELIQACRTHVDRHIATAYPLLDGVRSSTDTLGDLCAKENLRDSYVVARTVYETAINACFITIGGSDVAERAWRHARQKALRDLDRTIELAGKEVVNLRWSGADVALADEQNQQLLAEFTSRSGREVSSWTPESVHQRLERIHAHAGDAAVVGFVFGLLLYRHASEISHGTLYGALFSLGATNPGGSPRSIEHLRDHRIEHCRMLLMLIGFSLESLAAVLAPLVGQPDIAVRAKQAQKAFSNRKRSEIDNRQELASATDTVSDGESR